MRFRSMFLLATMAAAPAAAMDFCAGQVRTNCVVDGDTVWLNGEKIRLAEIDAPEPGGRCFAERDLAARSAERLRQLLGAGEPVVTRIGTDRFGRTLANISLAGRDVGATLIAEGLVRPWRGSKENWCK